MKDQTTEFWDRIDSINAGMLSLNTDLRFMPMSHYSDREKRSLWFITAKGTHLVDGLQSGPEKGQHLISSQGEGLYANIHGELSLSQDRAKLDEIWNMVASSWFEEGKEDPDLQLVEMQLKTAEIWVTGGSSKFLYEIAKSKVTTHKPDMGTHTIITF